MPGAPVGLQKEDPTIAELLKNHGYATGQFGKNHLGDQNEYLPTVHGFDEFFGNLYHLNAEEEPEQRTYPRDPEFKKKFGPRGVLQLQGDRQGRPDRATPASGRVGKQTIEDTGPLTKKRMETIDDETSDAAVDYIKRQTKAGKPFFCWYNSTRMHLRTHVAADRRSPPGLTARTEYADGMVEHDGHVGKLLKALDDLGIADDTIVLYTTDNGPHMNTWPDGAMTPFRSEKNTNWEGAFRVPCMIRWPGKIKAGIVSNEIVSGHDWLPTLARRGRRAGRQGEAAQGARGGRQDVQGPPRRLQPAAVPDRARSRRARGAGSSTSTTTATSSRLRVENWKVVFMEQRAPGTLRVWAEPFTPLRLPKLFDLRADPYERADITSNTYYDWLISQPYLIFAAQAVTGKFLDDVQGLPAPPAGRELQHRPGGGEDEAEPRQPLSSSG